MGPGADTCADYLEAIDRDQPGASDAYLHWIEGFISALDYLHRPMPERTKIDVQGVALWIKEFCKSSPSKPVFDAVLAFDRSGTPETQDGR